MEGNLVLAILGGALVLFLTDKIRVDVVALLVLLALALPWPLFADGPLLSADEALSGFSSKAVIFVACMFVFSRALYRNGVAHWLGDRIVRVAGDSPRRLRLFLVVAAGLVSALMNDTGTVAALIPVVIGLSRRLNRPPSTFLLPLAFGALLGGMTTLIGTSTNLAIDSAMRAKAAEMIADGAAGPSLVSLQAAVGGFSLFSFTDIGLVLLAAVCLFFLVSGSRFLPPEERTSQSLEDEFEVRSFLTELTLDPASDMVGDTIEGTGIGADYDVTVVGIVRGGEMIAAPGAYQRIREGDVLIVQGEPDALLRMRRDGKVVDRESVKVGDAILRSQDVRVVEVIVSPGSTAIGQTLRQMDFRDTTGCNALGLSHFGEVRPGGVATTPLSAGDALLLQGHRADIERLKRGRDFIVIDEIENPAPIGPKALMTMGVMAAVFSSYYMGLGELQILALAGVVALIFLRAIPLSEAYGSLNLMVLVLIAGMLPMGHAMAKHGVDSRILGWLGSGLGDATAPVLLGAVFAVTVALNQVIGHMPAAIMLTPLAMEVAVQSGHSVQPYVIAVILGASCSFMTPMGHQVNAMVMGPGNYRMRDYWRLGLPLTLLVGAIVVALLPVLHPVT